MKNKKFCLLLLFIVLLSVAPLLKSFTANADSKTHYDPVKVSDFHTLKKLLEEPGDCFIELSDDISYDVDDGGKTKFEYHIYVRGHKEIDLNGHDIYVWDMWNKYHNFRSEHPGVEGQGVDTSTLFYIGDGAMLVMNDSKGGSIVKFDAAKISASRDDNFIISCRNIFEVNGGGLIINNGEYNAGDNEKDYYYTVQKTVFPMPYDVLTLPESQFRGIDDIFGYAHTIVSGTPVHAVKGEVIINGGEFVGRRNIYSAREYCCALSVDPVNFNDVTVTVNNGSFDGRCGANAVFIRSNVEPKYFILNGGTFDVHHIDKERVCYEGALYKYVPNTYGTTFIPFRFLSKCEIRFNGKLFKDGEGTYLSEYRNTTNRLDLVPSKQLFRGYERKDDTLEKFVYLPDNSLVHYTPGTNLTFRVDNLIPLYENTGCGRVGGVDGRYDVTWKIEQYRDAKPTGKVSTIQNHSLEINLDKILDRFDNTEKIVWDEGPDVYYAINATVVEYNWTKYGVTSAVHDCNDPVFVSGYNNTITDWGLDLSRLEVGYVYKGTLESYSLDHDRSQSNLFRIYKVDAPDEFKAGETYTVSYYLEMAEGYVLKAPCKYKVPSQLTVLEVKTDADFDGTVASINQKWKAHFKVDVTFTIGKPLTGNAALGAVYPTYCSYYDVHTNATGREQFTFQTMDASGEITEGEWFSTVREAFEDYRLSGEIFIGQKVRLAVKAPGYLPVLYSSWRYVEKAPNNEVPKTPSVKFSKNGKEYACEITNYDPEQEYIVRSSYVDPSTFTALDWLETIDKTFTAKEGKVVIYTRYRETELTAPGSIVNSLTTCAGEAVYASDLMLDQNFLTVAEGSDVVLHASILPLTQFNMEPSSIRWYLQEGDKDIIAVSAGGTLRAFPTDGSYLAGADLKIRGLKQGVVTIAAEITLPGNTVKTALCSVYVSSGDEILIDSVTQPQETITLYPGDFYYLQQYTVTPYFGFDTAYYHIKWKIDSVTGVASHFSLSENGLLLVSEDAGIGEKAYVYPDFSEVYRYRGTRDLPVSIRCIEIVEEPAATEVNARARSGGAADPKSDSEEALSYNLFETDETTHTHVYTPITGDASTPETDRGNNMNDDLAYDETAHWFMCEDVNCPDAVGSKENYTAHNFIEIDHYIHDGKPPVHISVCSDCGYQKGEPQSYKLAEAEEKASVIVTPFNINDEHTYALYNYSKDKVVTTPLLYTEQEPAISEEYTTAVTPSDITETAEKGGSKTVLRILFGVLSVILVCGIVYVAFGLKTKKEA